MAASSVLHTPGVNRLLELLDRETQETLLRRMERVHLRRGDRIYRANQPIADVHFPLSGMVSLVVTMEDGLVVEVGTVGNEGMTAVPLLHGADSATVDAMSQVDGDAMRMAAADFARALAENRGFAGILNRYAEAFLAQVAQSTACNRLHPVEQRLARWLLMTRDRLSSDTLPLTQEFLAQMLGVRRASVNVVAGMLQRAGFIRYTRGMIHVLDLEGLESASCECYMIVRRHFERLLS